MKIRTDFVTNSSSYCTTEVIIDNPVLLRILEKYKDMGIFLGDPIFGIGEYRSRDGQFEERSYSERIKSPAFFYSEKQNDEGKYALFLIRMLWPESLDQVLECIISIIDDADKYLNEQICQNLKEELIQKKEEIKAAYTSVYWESSNRWDDGSNFVKFEFDPTEGTSYIYRDEDNVRKSEIGIGNPVLTEIFEKYKPLGLKNESPWSQGFVFAEFEPYDGPYVYFSGHKFFEQPTFYYDEQEGPNIGYKNRIFATICPKCKEDVLDAMLTVMQNGIVFLNEQVFAQMKDELLQRKDEISNSYTMVYWLYFDGEKSHKFEFDPVNGEKFTLIDGYNNS